MRSWILLLLAALLCAACTPAAPPPLELPSGASTEISAEAGGSVSLGEEATLLVPAGSLDHDTVIGIGRLESIPEGPADGFVPFGQGYELSPHGTAFSLAQPALLTVRVDGAALAESGLDLGTVQLFHFDEETHRYVNVAGAIDTGEGKLVAAVEHFSKYVLMAQTAALGDPGPLVTMQAPIPNVIRAAAPIYLRATVLPSPGTAVAAVRVFYRKLHPAGLPYQVGVMTPDNTPSMPGTNTYGFVVPASALGAADLAAGNDFQYYAEATDSLAVTQTLAAAPTSQDVTRTYAPGTLTLTPATLDISAGFERWLLLRGSDNAPSIFQMVSETLSVTSCPDGQPIGSADDQRASGVHFEAQNACTGSLAAAAGVDAVTIPIIVRPGQVESITLSQYEQVGGAEIRTPFDGTFNLSEGHVLDIDALGSDAYGNTMNVNVSWQADPALGSINAAGQLYALDGDGFGQVTASVGGVGGVSAVQWVNVVGRSWTPKGGAINVDPLAAWVPVGPMADARYVHTATRLQNGMVLVAGGADNGVIHSSAELYDAATGSWTDAPAMNSHREHHTATLLANGQVLVTGGNNGSSINASAEIYDPATHAWTYVGAQMTVPRHAHEATLLPSGQVLVTGGYNGSNINASAEIYDPATHAWTNLTSMPVARYVHASTLLSSGLVLVTGGHDGISSIANADLYDPATKIWTSLASMLVPRHGHTATLLPGGKVLVTGGHDNGNYTASAEIYDPATGSWTSAGTMTTARHLHTATLLPSGKVLVAGGVNASGSVAGVEIYDPATNTWTAVEAMNAPRAHHATTLLSSGRLLLTGGIPNGPVFASAEIYLASQPAPRPAVAVSGSTPYVAWHETDAVANHIYVKHWTGTAWAQDGLSPLNVNPGQEATFPRIAFAGATPYVAWQEQGPAATQIQVKHWNGGAWVQDVAASLNVNPAKNATAPAIAASGATPYVAWQEAGAAASQIYVRRWSGVSWAQLGGSLNQNPGKDAAAPAIAVVGTTPYVAWQEAGAAGNLVYIKHWTGSAWVADGGSLNVNPAADAVEPAIVMQGTVPYVTWRETLGGNSQVYVAHWTGVAWVQDGPSLSNDPTRPLGTPAIDFFNGTPYVAWREDLAGVSQTYVKHLNGAAWLPNGSTLNADIAQGAFPPSLAFAGPTPYVTWAETTGSVFSVHVKGLE